jgi:hypothetical protein
VALHVDEHQGGPLLDREGGQRGQECAPPVGADGRLLRVVLGAGGGEGRPAVAPVVEVVGQRLGAAYLGGPETVETGVDHDAVQPGGDGGVAAEAVGAPVRRDQTVLEPVGRVVRVARRAHGHRPEPVSVPGEEPRERLGVARDVRGEELGVGGLRTHR